MRTQQTFRSERTTEALIQNLIVHGKHVQDVHDLDELIERAGQAKVVMLGESSHGTHEFYTWRSMISKRLINEHGFNFIAVEGDWPDAYRLNRYIKNYPQSGDSAFSVLHAFNRWPTWMWANWEMVALAEWLYNFNQEFPAANKAGFYGLDVYSLWESLESIINYLKKTDPTALVVAQEAFKCFEPYQDGEGQAYARASQFVPKLCEYEVVNLLKVIRQSMVYYNSDYENVFSAEQNALVMSNAEKYYRAMVHGGAFAWNIRDRHMADTLLRLLDFHGPQSKAIVWAHNTHIGDARATIMRDQGQFNLGELMRNELGFDQVFLTGLGTYRGTVIAAEDWGSPMQTMAVPPAQENSWDGLMHSAYAGPQWVLMQQLDHPEWFSERIRQRAIGVVYHPQSELRYNYVPSEITNRYDAYLFFDRTTALHPLHVPADQAQMPETFPFGV